VWTDLSNCSSDRDQIGAEFHLLLLLAEYYRAPGLGRSLRSESVDHGTTARVVFGVRDGDFLTWPRSVADGRTDGRTGGQSAACQYLTARRPRRKPRLRRRRRRRRRHKRIKTTYRQTGTCLPAGGRAVPLQSARRNETPPPRLPCAQDRSEAYR